MYTLTENYLKIDYIIIDNVKLLINSQSHNYVYNFDNFCCIKKKKTKQETEVYPLCDVIV